MAKRTKVGLFDWLRQDGILGYIINSYMGTGPVPKTPWILRRIFMWTEDDEIKQGNTEAFILHLGRRFERPIRASEASALHELMRDLGEIISSPRSHARPQKNSPNAGKFRQPSPEVWVIGGKKE